MRCFEKLPSTKQTNQQTCSWMELLSDFDSFVVWRQECNCRSFDERSRKRGRRCSRNKHHPFPKRYLFLSWCAHLSVLTPVSVKVFVFVCILVDYTRKVCTHAQMRRDNMCTKYANAPRQQLKKFLLEPFFNNLDVFLCLCVCVCTFVVCTCKSSSWNERHPFPITKISPSVTEPHRNCQHPLTYVYCSTTKPLSICELHIVKVSNDHNVTIF